MCGGDWCRNRPCIEGCFEQEPSHPNWHTVQGNHFVLEKTSYSESVSTPFFVRIFSYLKSFDPFPGGRRSLFSWTILLFWAGCIIVVSIHHELWRDEVRALSLALSTESFLDLPDALRNEGHPMLWYLILRLGYLLIQTPVVLKIASIAIASVSIFLFFRFSPFPIWLKLLFLGTVLPAYEYSVMCRNYGISMLLFFAFAALYCRKKGTPFLLALLLVALAHTNAHSLIFVFSLAVYLFCEGLRTGGPQRNRKDKLVFCSSFLMLGIGVLLAILTILPDGNSIVMESHALTFQQILAEFWRTIQHPGAKYETIFIGFPSLLRDVLIWIFFLGLFIRPYAAIIFLVGSITLSVFFSIGYSGTLRHQGIFFIFLLTVYWIVFFHHRDNKSGNFLAVHKSVIYVALPLVFIAQIALSYKKISRDLTQEMSSSRAFGEYISANKAYESAIIIGEPDIRLESLPYYVDNPLYVPREQRFSRYVKLTRDNTQELSMGELLVVAQSLRASENKPILIALGHFGLADQQNPPFTRTEQYEKRFTWTKDELESFQDCTEKVAEFKQDVENERYEVYQLK